MQQEPPIIAVCGLDCAACAIYQAPHDPAIAQRLTDHVRAHGHQDAEPSWFHCSTCRGEQSPCWSADCWIRQCCVGEHGLDHCSECPGFPCARLEEWAGANERYGAALDRLREMAGHSRAQA